MEDNNNYYSEVSESGMAALLCLGHDVYVRTGRQPVEILPQLARAKAMRVHRRLRRGIALSCFQRWSGMLADALQKAVATAVLRSQGADLLTTLVDHMHLLADLPPV